MEMLRQGTGHSYGLHDRAFRHIPVRTSVLPLLLDMCVVVQCNAHVCCVCSQYTHNVTRCNENVIGIQIRYTELCG